MKINRINNTYDEKLAPKKTLTMDEYKTLARVLQILIRTHIFFEYGDYLEEADVMPHLLYGRIPGIPEVVYSDDEQIQLYDLEDYLIHSAYMTEQDDIIITAYLKRSLHGMYTYPENLRYFKVSDSDCEACEFTTDELYYCFVIDVPIETVDL